MSFSESQSTTLEDSLPSAGVNLQTTRRLTSLVNNPVGEKPRPTSGSTYGMRPSGPSRGAMVAPESRQRATETPSSGEASPQHQQHPNRAQRISKRMTQAARQSNKSADEKQRPRPAVWAPSGVKTVHYEIPKKSTSRRLSSLATTESLSTSQASAISQGAPNDTAQMAPAPPHGGSAQAETKQHNHSDTSEESSLSTRTTILNTRYLADEHTPSRVKTTKEVAGGANLMSKMQAKRMPATQPVPQTRRVQLRAAAKSSLRSSSEIDMDDLVERLQKRSHVKTKSKAPTSTAKSPVKGIADVNKASPKVAGSNEKYSSRRNSSAATHAPQETAVEVTGTKNVTRKTDVQEKPASQRERPKTTAEQLRAEAKSPSRSSSKFVLSDLADRWTTSPELKTRAKALHSTSKTPDTTIGDVNNRSSLTSVAKTVEHAQLRVAPRNFGMPAENVVIGYRLSREEYMLYPLALFLGVAFFIFLVYTLIPRMNLPKGPKAIKKEPLGGVCELSRCIKNAIYLSSLLSWDEVNPCHNFYAFVCRRWTGSYAVSSPASVVSSDDDHVAYLESRLHALLTNGSQQTNVAVQPAGDLYRKCMDKNRIEDDQWNPLLELMSQVFLEGFPFTPPVRRSLSIWKTAARLLRMTGTSALFSVGVSSHPSTPNRDVVFIAPPMLVMSFDNADINAVSRLYTEAAFAAVSTLKKEYVPSAFIAKIAEFASELEKVVGSTPRTNAPKLVNFTSLPPFSLFLHEVFNDSKTVSFKKEYQVMISPFTLVNKVLKFAHNAELHTVMNYFGVRLMIEVSPFIPDSGLTDFYGAFIYGRRRVGVPRWTLCVRAVEKATFPLTYASILADLNAHIATSRLTNMANQVFAEFRRDLQSSPHFTSESKLIIQRALDTTSVRALGPEWVNNRASIEAYAQKLADINSYENKTALATYVSFYEHTFQTSVTLHPSQRWSRSAFSPDCWHEPNADAIYVPVLAFNISHAFQGGNQDLQISRLAPRLYRCAFALLLSKDELEPSGSASSWLTDETERTLRNLEGCIDPADASNDASFRKTREVLAVNFTYNLFMKALRASQDTFSLQLSENRDLSDKQLFFVFLVLQACEQSGEYDNHASATGHNWNIALSHTKYFGEAYACQRGSPMNTKKNCVYT